MADGYQVRPADLLTHADSVGHVALEIAQAQRTAVAATLSVNSYGVLCAFVPSLLEPARQGTIGLLRQAADREIELGQAVRLIAHDYQRTDQDIASSFDGLRSRDATALGRLPGPLHPADRLTPIAPYTAPVSALPVVDRRLTDEITALRQRIESRSWVDQGVGGSAVSLELLGRALDPLSVLDTYGIPQLTVPTRPLRETLDRLRGDPARITAFVQAWRGTATTVAGASTRYEEAVARELELWAGRAADAYRRQAGVHISTLRSAAEAALTLAAAALAAGELVARVRMSVFQLLSVLATRLSTLAAQARANPAGLTPQLLAQATRDISDCSQRITTLLTRMMHSLRALGALLHRLEQLVAAVDQALAALVRPTPGGASALRLPTTAAEAYALRQAIESRLASHPGQPVIFKDGEVTVAVMRGAQPFPVFRQDGQTFTAAALSQDTAAPEVIINGQLYDGSPFRGNMGPSDPANFIPQGQTVVGSNVVAGRSSPDTFYLSYQAGDAAGGPARWEVGKGDPPTNGGVAFGGGIPLLVDGLPYGERDSYVAGAPAGLPATGDPGAGNEGYLTQRSSAGFASMNSGGGDLGKVVVGTSRDSDLVVVLAQEQGRTGLDLAQMRDRLVTLGVTDAVAFDGSTSATMVVDNNVVVHPSSRKDNVIPVGIGFRTRPP